MWFIRYFLVFLQFCKDFASHDGHDSFLRGKTDKMMTLRGNLGVIHMSRILQFIARFCGEMTRENRLSLRLIWNSARDDCGLKFGCCGAFPVGRGWWRCRGMNTCHQPQWSVVKTNIFSWENDVFLWCRGIFFSFSRISCLFVVILRGSDKNDFFHGFMVCVYMFFRYSFFSFLLFAS